MSLVEKILRWSMALAAVALAVVAGLPFSPHFDPVLYWIGKVGGQAFGTSPLAFHGTTVVICVGLLLAAAIPALIARRFVKSSLLPPLIWLAVATGAAWPALRIAAGLDD